MFHLQALILLTGVLVATGNAQVVNFRQELLDAINAARKEKGLAELCLNEELMDATQTHVNDMAMNKFIKSVGSDGSTPKDRALNAGFRGADVTEMVAAGYKSASSVVAAWAKAESAPNTLFSESTVMGAGYVYDRTLRYVHFWAVDFSDGECSGNGNAAGGPLPPTAEIAGQNPAPRAANPTESGAGLATVPGAAGNGINPSAPAAPAPDGPPTPAGAPGAPAPDGDDSAAPSPPVAPGAPPAPDGPPTPAGAPGAPAPDGDEPAAPNAPPVAPGAPPAPDGPPTPGGAPGAPAPDAPPAPDGPPAPPNAP